MRTWCIHTARYRHKAIEKGLFSKWHWDNYLSIWKNIYNLTPT